MFEVILSKLMSQKASEFAHVVLNVPRLYGIFQDKKDDKFNINNSSTNL